MNIVESFIYMTLFFKSLIFKLPEQLLPVQLLILIDPPVQLLPPFLASWTISRVAVIWPGAQATEQVDHVRLHAPH